MELDKIKYLKSFAIAIKENSKILGVIGLVFFISTAFFGIWWIVNPSYNKTEPITFILGFCSSVFWGLPQLAEVILPNRKALRHMTYNELIEFMLATDSSSDWQEMDREVIVERFLKEDPRLRIFSKQIDEGIHLEDFREQWANNHQDPGATSYFYNVLYDGNFIHRIILVQVDGGRALLPLPDLSSMNVKQLDLKIASIFDGKNTLDDYLKRSGIIIS
jgi:hypothetical protein